MKRLSNEVEKLSRNIEAISASPYISSDLKEQFDLQCIVRDAGRLDAELNDALNVFMRASQVKRVVKEDLGKAVRRACAFVAKVRGPEGKRGERTAEYRKMLARRDGADGFAGLAPELLQTLDSLEGDRAAAETLRLARALKLWLNMETSANRARERYTHLLTSASSLTDTLKAINSDLTRRLEEASAEATQVWLVRAAA